MKTLEQEVSLFGKCESISLSEFRSRPGETITSVQLGKVYILTKNGKPIAVLSKVPGESLTEVVAPDGTSSFKL